MPDHTELRGLGLGIATLPFSLAFVVICALATTPARADTPSPGIAAIDREGTAAAARQFLPGPSRTVVWDDPDSSIERPQRQFRGRSPDTEQVPLIQRRRQTTDFVEPNLASTDRRQRLSRRLNQVERELAGQPRTSSARRAVDPARDRRDDRRRSALQRERQDLLFELNIQQPATVRYPAASVPVRVRTLDRLVPRRSVSGQPR